MLACHHKEGFKRDPPLHGEEYSELTKSVICSNLYTPSLNRDPDVTSVATGNKSERSCLIHHHLHVVPHQVRHLFPFCVTNQSTIYQQSSFQGIIIQNSHYEGLDGELRLAISFRDISQI